MDFDTRIKNTNFIQISGWMINELELTGVRLLVYAIIYGFSQDGKNQFTGNLKYLCEFTGATKPTVIKIIKSLLDESLIIKDENYVNGQSMPRYRANIQKLDFDIEKKTETKVSKNIKSFVPPTEEEVINYFKENGYREDAARKVFNYYNVANWRDKDGKQVLNWKQKVIAVWFKDENKINPTQSYGNTKNRIRNR
ncbi:helix-turn-helix domain-containing protein [Elizabethkingia anophelis]|uniref:helix-turn-helix domain-containing protein n=1 Tax=Elizabethkingia anophelis TaxID=1117645 RepID=UPI003461EDEA